MNLNIVNLGLIPYDEALDIQYKLLEKRKNDEIDNTLLLLEHPPVLTLGTRGEYQNIYLPTEELKRQGVEIFEVNRGGDVTYHGPGQIVGYPIIDLRDVGKDTRIFIQKIEQSIINLLQKEYGIHAYGETDKYTGVWVNDKKITAIGIAVRKWITMHGFAFNVNTNLDHFKWINPCGLSKGVTSVEQLIGKKEDMNIVYEKVEYYFAGEFEFIAVKKELKDLL
jgi:lipoyl(octanoyl) transferase